MFQLELWDTAGIERFATMSSSYFQSANAAIVCFALDSRESFGLISQHLLDAVMHSNTAKIFVCGNKLDVTENADDVNSERFVSDQDISDFCESCGTAISGCYKVSCQTNEGVAEMFNHVASVLYSNMYERFDRSRIKIHEHQPPAPEEAKKNCC